jgi:hypothetical protein
MKLSILRYSRNEFLVFLHPLGRGKDTQLES